MVYVKVPIFPAIQVAELKGNLHDGIKATLGSNYIVSGTVTIGLDDTNWITLSCSITIFGVAYEIGTLQLVPLPDWLRAD